MPPVYAMHGWCQTNISEIDRTLTYNYICNTIRKANDSGKEFDMVTLGSLLREIRKTLKNWRPETGFNATRLNYSPADIIFGARVAAILKKDPDHRKNVKVTLLQIKKEAMLDKTFNCWLLNISMKKFCEVVEFSYFPVPIKKESVHT